MPSASWFTDGPTMRWQRYVFARLTTRDPPPAALVPFGQGLVVA